MSGWRERVQQMQASALAEVAAEAQAEQERRQAARVAGSRRGGQAAAARMTPAQRSARARKAALAAQGPVPIARRLAAALEHATGAELDEVMAVVGSSLLEAQWMAAHDAPNGEVVRMALQLSAALGLTSTLPAERRAVREALDWIWDADVTADNEPPTEPVPEVPRELRGLLPEKESK